MTPSWSNIKQELDKFRIFASHRNAKLDTASIDFTAAFTSSAQSVQVCKNTLILVSKYDGCVEQSDSLYISQRMQESLKKWTLETRHLHSGWLRARNDLCRQIVSLQPVDRRGTKKDDADVDSDHARVEEDVLEVAGEKRVKVQTHTTESSRHRVGSKNCASDGACM